MRKVSEDENIITIDCPNGQITIIVDRVLPYIDILCDYIDNILKERESARNIFGK